MKKYFSIACALLIATASFSQNTNLIKGKKLPAPQQKNSSKQVVRKSTQSGVSTFTSPFLAQQKVNPLLSIGQINLPVVKKTVSLIDVNSPDIIIDTRDLKFSENGLLLSPDGYEIEFRTSGNKKVTDVCSTPRPYVIDPVSKKNAACSFSVPCDDAANRDATPVGAIKYFQLRWHVMMNGGATSNIDQSMIDAMMVTLNADYAIHNMVFCEDSARWVEDNTNYFHDSNTEEVSLKTTYNTRPADLINIYVVGDMTAGGYARFPYDPMGGTNFRGGIVMNRGNCNANGHTLAHEMGHTFGLEHTFAGVDERAQCSDCYERVRDVASGSSNASGLATPLGGPFTQQGDKEGDWCSDTNPHNTNTYQCNTAAGPMGGCDAGPWQNAPVNNHMSYSFCDSQFTTQQRYRQHCMADAYLGSWTAYGGGICGAQPPVAEFSGTPTTWGSPSNVVFTDLSAPTAIIDTWTWNFNNAGQTGTVVPAIFVGQTPPTVVYTLPGAAAACQDYEVSLTITSANGNDTETKTAYITVCPPGGDCDTLDTDYNNIGPTNTIYNGAFGLFTGVPNEGSVALADPAAFYEMYFTPNPTTSIVGGVNVALGGLNDPDDDMIVQIAIYNDLAGFPDIGGGPIVVQAYSPTALGVPNGGFIPFWIPITNPNTPITTATFHVGVEIFPGDATDSLYVISNVDGEGDGAPMTNFTNSTGCGLTDFNDPTGVYCPTAGYAPVNFDMWIIPMMGEYAPRPTLTGFTETVVCDTSFVTITDTVLYHDYAGTALVGMSYTFLSDGFNINSTTPLGSIDRTYTTAGPDVLRITAINDCGRSDTTFWTIPYNFMPTPDAEFTKVQPNDVCMNTVIDFNANTPGYQDYDWDFGDGTVASSGSSSATTHTYTAPGTYYTTLTTTSTGYQPDDVFYFEDFNAGIPGTYNLVDQDGLTMNPAYAVIGSNWFGNAGQAISSSWFNPAGTANDWMITPAIGVLPANQMLSWIGEASNANFPDGYEVRISTTAALPATAANFNTVLFSIGAENAYPTTRAVSLAAYAGQTVFIAFVNNSTDMDILMIDDVWVGTTGPGCVGSQHKDDFVVVIDCSVIPPTADMDVSDSTGCAPLNVSFTDITTLGDPAISWVWNFGDGSFSTLQNPPVHLYNTPGTYFASFEACNTGGCTTEFISIVIGTGVTADAGLNDTICGGTTATLAGNDPTPDAGQWTLISSAGTPGITALNSFNSGVTALAAGLNEFAWTITGTGCVTVDTVGIFISTQESAGLDDLTSTLCNTVGNTIDLNTLLSGNTIAGTWAETSLSGQFTVGTGVFDANTLAAGAYNFIYYVVGTSPCINDTADFTVTVSAIENAGLDDLTATLCNTAGNTLDLNTLLSGNTIAGTWSEATASGQFTVGTGVFDANTLTAGAYNFIYFVTSTAPCANDTASFTVTISAGESAGLDDLTASLCNAAGSTLDLNTLLSGNTVVGTWEETTASGQFTVGTGVFDASSLTAGAYNFICYVTNAAPCANDTANFTVMVTALDDATFTYADFCANATGLSGGATTIGGTYSFNPDLLDGSLINGASGDITNANADSTYFVQYSTPASACSSSLTLSIVANGIPTVSNILETCNVANTDYAVSFDVAGGTGGPYTVSENLPGAIGGAFVVNAWTSNLITAGVAYDFDVDDANGCGPVNVSGNKICICVSDAGTMDVTPLDLCETDVATATQLTPFVLDPNDYVMYVLHTNNTGTLGTVLDTNVVAPTFSFSAPPLTAGVTYYISTVVGDSLGNFVDFNDGCLQVAPGTPVTWEAAPDAGANDSTTTLCNSTGSTIDLNTLLTVPAVGVWAETTTSTQFTVGTGVFDANGLTAGVYAFTYTVAGTNCPNDISYFGVTVSSQESAGLDDLTGTLCNFNGSTLDLNTLLNGNTIAGTWVETTASGQFVVGTGVFDGTALAAGAYNFIYYVANTAPCSNDTANFTVTISAGENAGTDDLTATLCNLGSTLDLNTLLVGNTIAGTWSETTASGQFTFGTGVFDGTALAAGAYNFIYYVANTTPCTNDTANFTVTISAGENAGADDITSTLCNTAGSTLDLNNLLSGNTIVGSWTETTVIPSGQFTSLSGVFDGNGLTAGTYTFVYYVVNGIPCVNDTANFTVTVTGGESAGLDDLTGVLCNTVGSTLDLNTLLSGNTIVGSWSETTVIPSGQFTSLSGVFDGNGLTAGVYTFVYIVTNTTPCVNDTAIFTVTINAIEVAGLDDFTSALCNLPGSTIDLNTLLSGNTVAGTWAETSGSVQLNTVTGEFDADGLIAGTYTFIYYVSSGSASCANDTADFTVTVGACSLPVASFTASALSICVGEDITFTDNSTGQNINNWAWNFDFGNVGGITPATANTQGAHLVSFSTAGTYNIQLLITDSVGTDDTTITVTVNNCITADFTMSSNTICAGDSIIFTNTSVSTIPLTVWAWDFDLNNVGGILPSIGYDSIEVIVFFQNPGTYDIQFEVSDGGVIDTVIKTVTITDCRPVPDFTISNDTICRDGSVTFTDLSTGNPTEYDWLFPGGTPSTSVLANPGVIVYNTEGIYAATLTVTNPYGTSINTFTGAITVIDCDPPFAVILLDDENGEICENNCIQFTYKDTLGLPDSLVWTFEGAGVAFDTIVSYDPTQPINVCWPNDSTGTFAYSVLATNAYDTSSANGTVMVHDNPIIFAGNDVTVDYGFDTQIRGEVRDAAGNIITALGGTITWSPETFLNSPTDIGSEVIQPTDTTNYTVTFVDENGCTASDDVNVNVNFIFNIGVPSAFTPLGSSNNILYVKGKLGIKTMNFVIYNRYGQKVFETTDIDQGWNGTHNGKELNPGVFVYYVKTTFVNGSTGELKGNVTLIK
jgi:gliding motility-associated-like protein